MIEGKYEDMIYHNKKKNLSEYYGHGEYKGRYAMVILTGGIDQEQKFEVVCFENDLVKKIIPLADKSLRYAEDTAENWVTGIGSFAKKQFLSENTG